MAQVSDRDVEAMKQWLAKEQHLPKNFDDLLLKKFLYSCDNSLERTKKCINEFCTRRTGMPEVFINRDPLSKELQKYFAMTTVATYMDGDNEILIYLLKETPDDFDHYTCSRTLSTQVDKWLMQDVEVIPENHIVVMDIKNFTLKLITKLKIFHLKMVVAYLLEGMPIRLRHVHFVNSPSYYEYLYNIVKPAFPDYLIDLMHFHTDYTGLYKFVNQASLPKEYGGQAQSIEERSAEWVNEIIEKRKLFLDDNLWKADLSHVVKNGHSDNSMNGSFKTLEFD